MAARSIFSLFVIVPGVALVAAQQHDHDAFIKTTCARGWEEAFQNVSKSFAQLNLDDKVSLVTGDYLYSLLNCDGTIRPWSKIDVLGLCLLD